MSTGLRNKLNGINVNLVTNGSFETDLTGWTNTQGATRDTVNPISGQTAHLKLTPSGAASGEGRYTAAITGKAGQLYKATLYGKQDSGGSGNLQVLVGTAAGGSQVYSHTLSLTTSWAQYELFFRVPDGTSSAYLTLKTSTVTAADVVYADLVTLSHSAGNLQEVFRKGFIKIYNGSQPTSADDAPGGTLLCTIYSDGTSTGLTFGDSASGTMAKSTAETWSGTAVATATAGWFRFSSVGDGGGSSTTDERIDGTVATSGAQLNMSSTSVTTSAVQTISTFQITVPAE
jgi:hypothetical protein